MSHGFDCTGLRGVDVLAPRTTDRIVATLKFVADRDATPELADPGLDPVLLADRRALVLAIIAAHRWTRDDHHPSGRRSGHAFLAALRLEPPWPTLDLIQ
ncbi:MAG: hypothetical protein WCP59_17525 [Actinomycetota bacterium]